jgi:hypothetical protein
MCVNARRILVPTDNNFSWETVFTAGFELDVLKRKRPYMWTIWVSPLGLSDMVTAEISAAISRNTLHCFTWVHPVSHRNGW